jgi:DNA-binding SARP family transcriptional activator/predicted ATPase
MSRLSLYLLGPPRIERDGRPVKVDTRKAIALLAYIAITGQSHRRDSLINLLWPDYDPHRGRTNLRRTLYALRKARAGDWLDVDREEVQLDPSADVWLDVDEFHRHLAECQTHGHAPLEVCPTCLDPLTAAVTLYRGDFLTGFSLKDSLNFDDWQFLQAEDLRGEFAGALERLVEGHRAQGAFDSSLHYARRWLALDPLNEAAHCQLMQLYDWCGERSAAMRQYQECVQVLQDQLGIAPQASTTALYQAIAEGRALRPPVGPVRYPLEKGLGGPGVRAAVVPPADRERDTLKTARSGFVARERELAQLDRLLDLARAGQRQVVFVTGGPGRGKTALIEEFARCAQERSADTLFAGGNCNAHIGFGDPYLPFREILALLTGDVDALWNAGAITREHARRLWGVFSRVVEALVEVGPDLIDTFIPSRPLLRRAMAYTAGGMSDHIGWLGRLKELMERKADLPYDPNLGQSALFEQYARVLGALARERPLLLALDDLQWADAGSIGLLFHLGRRLTGARILIVGAYRPEELAIGRGGERHPLEPVVNEFQRTFGDVAIDLARAEDRLFVEQYLDSEPNRLSAGFREMLHRQTGGHPLFTVELLRGMQERGDLVQDATGRWVEGPALDWETLPKRVEAVIAERVGRLDRAAREALRVASVEGEIFTAEVVAQVRSADAREMVACLSGDLERRHRLVRAQEIQRLGTRRLSRYRFRHILFQSYLYHSLDAVQRAHLHEAVGIALEGLYGEETGEIAVSLARHFQEARVAEKAVTYLFQAGEKAKRGSANEEAMAHLNRGLELLKTLPETPQRSRRELDLQIALGVPLILTKSHAAPEVGSLYSRARELCEQIGDPPQLFQALLGLRRFYLHRGELPRARELGERLLALAQDEQDLDLRLRAHMMQGETLYRMGEFLDAQDQYDQGIALYDPQGHRYQMYLYGNDAGVLSQVFQGLTLWHLGYPDQALQVSREGLSRARELDHPFTLACALYFTAVLHRFRREVGSVRELTEALLGISRERGFALYRAWGTVLHGWALAEQAELEEGVTQMARGLAAWRDMGAELLLPHFLSFLAEAYGKADHVGAGLQLATDALEMVEETGERTYEAELQRLKGELLLRQGAGEAPAEECFQHALDAARRQNAKSWELRAAMSLARLWQKQGDIARARELLRGVHDWFTEGLDTADLTEARALLDGLA